MDPRTCTSLINVSFGQLRVTARTGTRVYRGRTRNRLTSIWTLVCPKGHTERRTRISLCVTGNKTQCKLCFFEKYGKHIKE